MFIWFPYKTPDLFEPQYNTPLPKVHTHMTSYSFPNAAVQWPDLRAVAGIDPMQPLVIWLFRFSRRDTPTAKVRNKILSFVAVLQKPRNIFTAPVRKGNHVSQINCKNTCIREFRD